MGPHKIWKLTWFVFAIKREAIQRIWIIQPSHDALTKAVVSSTDSIYTDSCPSIVVCTQARTQSRLCPPKRRLVKHFPAWATGAGKGNTNELVRRTQHAHAWREWIWEGQVTQPGHAPLPQLVPLFVADGDREDVARRVARAWRGAGPNTRVVEPVARHAQGSYRTACQAEQGLRRGGGVRWCRQSACSRPLHCSQWTGQARSLKADPSPANARRSLLRSTPGRAMACQAGLAGEALRAVTVPEWASSAARRSKEAGKRGGGLLVLFGQARSGRLRKIGHLLFFSFVLPCAPAPRGPAGPTEL